MWPRIMNDFVLCNEAVGAGVARNATISIKPGFVEKVSSAMMQTIPKRDVGYKMTNNAYPCTLASG
jgi:hypothetical protein